MLAEATLGPEALIRRWTFLGAQSTTPDHYEINEFGELIMSPRPSNDHQRIVQAAAFAIRAALGPEVVTEVSVLTDRGIRVPDAVWMPPEMWASSKGKTPLPFVPVLCLEVLSPGNTNEEMLMKIGAYLRCGAKEVIVVGLDGTVRIHGDGGLRSASALGVVLDLPEDLF